MKKILSNGAMATLAQIVGIVYGLVLPRLILNQYGAELNGLTQSIKQFLSVISFLDLGVGQVMRSALYRPLVNKNKYELSSVMASGRDFYRKLAYVLVGYAIVLMFIYPLFIDQKFGFIYTATLIGAMAISSFAQFFFSITNEQLLQADQKGYIIYGFQIVSNLLNLLVCSVLVSWERSIHEVKLATSLIFLVRPLVLERYVRSVYCIDKHVHYTKDPVKQKWDGVAQHLSAVILDGTDTIVLTMMSTLVNVSIYSVYYMVIASIQSFYQAAVAGIQSAVGEIWTRQNRNEMDRVFSHIEKLLHYAVVFMFCCAGLLIVPFVRVYTAGLTDADYIQPVFSVLLVIAYSIRCLRTPYNIWILAAGHFKQTRACHIISAVLNLSISIIAVAEWGLVGVAVGTLIAMVYQTLWMSVYSTGILLKRPLRGLVRQFAIDILISALICLAAGKIKLEMVSYWGWFVMAMKVAGLALGVIVMVSFVFCRKELVMLYKRLLRR